ncbi:MAG: hypothetical protein ACKVH0_07390, partial [Alphaproteobacteria bacterium]
MSIGRTKTLAINTANCGQGWVAPIHWEVRSMKLKTTLFAAATVLVGMASGAVAQDKSTVDIIKERGFMNCQVGQPSPGF